MWQKRQWGLLLHHHPCKDHNSLKKFLSLSYVRTLNPIMWYWTPDNVWFNVKAGSLDLQQTLLPIFSFITFYFHLVSFQKKASTFISTISFSTCELKKHGLRIGYDCWLIQGRKRRGWILIYSLRFSGDVWLIQWWWHVVDLEIVLSVFMKWKSNWVFFMDNKVRSDTIRWNQFGILEIYSE